MTENVILFVPKALADRAKLDQAIDNHDEIEAELAGQLRSIMRLRADLVAAARRARNAHAVTPGFRRRLKEGLHQMRDLEKRICAAIEDNDARRLHLIKAAQG
jgi:arginine deiminase